MDLGRARIVAAVAPAYCGRVRRLDQPEPKPRQRFSTFPSLQQPVATAEQPPKPAPRNDSRPLSLVPGLMELPPVTMPPNTARPGMMIPPAVSPSTPLPPALAAAMEDQKRGARADYWLIAAAVVVFIIGFLLVVL
jgi:hypothetical protein